MGAYIRWMTNETPNDARIAGAESLYTGELGAKYHAQRSQYRSTATQRLRARFFRGFTDATHAVLDFGCGTGGILAELPAARRIGIEITEAAADEARRALDSVFSATGEVPGNSIDRVISFHALEHVESPIAIVRELRRVLRPDGRIRILVPCDVPVFSSRQRTWAENAEMHLHSWTPQTLGNLLTVAGFEVLDARMLPASRGGRLAGIFGEGSGIYRGLAYLKSIRTAHFHTAVTARSPG